LPSITASASAHSRDDDAAVGGPRAGRGRGTHRLGADELRRGPLRPGDRIRVVGEVLETRASRSGAPRGMIRVRLRHDSRADPAGLSGSVERLP
jgi:acyl dehydratase